MNAVTPPSADVTRGQLESQFEALQSAVLDFVRTCPAEGWKAVTADEGWLSGVTAHHIGAIHYPVIDQAQAIMDGRRPTVTTMADVDRLNAEHIRAHADCTPDETLAFLTEAGAGVRSWLTGISVADLRREADLPFMGGRTSVARLLQVVLIDLAEGHLRSARLAAGMAAVGER